MNSPKPTVHVSVLLNEVIEAAQPENGGVFVDGTFGGGGYTKALLEAGADKVIAIDRDPLAIERGQDLKKVFGDRLVLVNACFSEIGEILKQQKEENINGIILDLGFSSDQLDDPERGFAYKHDGPLDMRMGNSGDTAADVLATLDEKDLAYIFYRYGDEKRSRKIAKLIVERRDETPFTTTQQLKSLVEEVIPVWKGGGRHPAMRVFQALRIYVNQELEELENILPVAADLLKINGRLCVVSFHSLEDRMVKLFFRQVGATVARNKYKSNDKHLHERTDVSPDAPRFSNLYRKGILPSAEEISANLRARSSKLRVLERIA